MATETQVAAAGAERAVKPTLSVTDNRTGKTYELPVENGTIRAMDLRRIKAAEDDFGLMSYDPAYMNTASCRSRITFIDGDRGILRYRGYPIEQLAEQQQLPRGRLPDPDGRAADPGGVRRLGLPRSPTTPSSTRT